MFNCNNKEEEGRASDSVENDEVGGVTTRVLTRVWCDKWARPRGRQYTLNIRSGLWTSTRKLDPSIIKHFIEPKTFQLFKI